MELQNGMTCSVCEVGELVERFETMEFGYKGKTLAFSEKVFVCAECKESFFDPSRNRSIEQKLTDFRREVEGGGE